MTRTRTLTLLVSLLLVSVWAASAAEFDRPDVFRQSAQGRRLQGSRHAQEGLRAHAQLREERLRRGHGGGQVPGLRRDGNKTAESALRASAKTDDIRVHVSGDLRGRARTTLQLRLDSVIPLGQRLMALQTE